ncbi:phage head morphogenesis protein, partial [Rothia dentocariosa]
QLAQLPVDPEWRNATFGPDWSLPPDALDKPNEQGFVDPRQYQYPVAWNIPGRHVFRGHVSWDLLKEAADQPLFRACIEIRKQRISTLDWCFRISPQYAAKMAKSSGKSQQEIEEDLRKQYQDEIDELTAFWQVPDRKNGYEFSDWMNLVQEEQLTWDALAIFPSRTYGGDLTNLTVLDGSTIKPLLDEKGGRPTPPFPAYQQILYGYPRGDYTADTVDRDGKLVVPDAY